MAGQYSPLTLIAGSGCMPSPPGGVGKSFLSGSPTLANAIVNYKKINVVSSYSNIIASLDGLSAQQNLAAIGLTDRLPTVTDTLPPGYTMERIFPAPVYDNSIYFEIGDLTVFNNVVYVCKKSVVGIAPPDNTYWDTYFYPNSLSNAVAYAAIEIMGRGDLSKFCQVFSAAVGYVQSANDMLASARGADVLAQTFSPTQGGMNTITTGGLNQVTSDITKFADDARKLGQLINLSTLNNWGLPGEVLAQITRVAGGIPGNVNDLLIAGNVGTVYIDSLKSGNPNFDGTLEKRIYTVMRSINGPELEQVLDLLSVTTPNITVMADLLDPKKIFPNSYQTLVCPTGNNLANVYGVSSTGITGVNAGLVPVVSNPGVAEYTGVKPVGGYETLKLIIPADLALANKALAYSLQQLKGVNNSSLPNLALAATQVQTNSGLTLVNSLTTPVPAGVTGFIRSSVGNGSGPGGTVILSDVIGVAIGAGNITNNFTTINSVFANNSSVFASLTASTGVFTVMANTVAGNYTVTDEITGNFYVDIPAGLPGNGNYGPAATATDAVDLAFNTGLIPAANTAIYTISINNAAIANTINGAAANIAAEMARQKTNQNAAQINFNELAGNSQQSVMTFATNLHEYALDAGANVFLTSMADTSTLAGQSVIGSLREGRNIVALQEAGIELDTQLPVSYEPTTESESQGSGQPWSASSTNWNKSSTITAEMRNWGLYRSWLGRNITNWGSGGIENQTGTVSVLASGYNVDVVIVDAVIDPAHPEFAVNADGTGGSRVKYYNWYQANIPGDPNAGGTYNPPITTNRPNSSDDSRHACHVAGTVAGNTQGWAPRANIYNISPQYVTGGVPYQYLYKYILAWHLAKRAAGNTNPTICNNSWYSRFNIPYTSITSVTWRGTTYTGPFTLAQLLNYGITNNGAGNCIVTAQYATTDADIQSCIDAGIIMVACAGNDDSRISDPGDIDYDNRLVATGFNSGNPIYYTRPSSPVCSNVINVGAIRSSASAPVDGKASFSNTGPRVNLFAPGSQIISAWLTTNGPAGQPTPVPDPRNPAYYLAKDSGTSMAAPQATGILACALEINRSWNQINALQYIISNAAPGQITDTGGGYADVYSLQGAPNLYLTLPANIRGA